VSDGWNSVVNQGDRGQHIFPTDDDRHRTPGCLSELHGVGIAEGAGL